MDVKQSLDAYGVSERLAQTDAMDELVAELKINGFAILESGFPAEFIDRLKSGIDRVYKRQVDDIGGESVLQKINDADTARCMLAYEQDFLHVATSEPLMQLARRFLGPEYVLMMQNGLLNRPDRENYQAKWHRDLNYQHWTSSKPMALNALLCIDEFTYENGATFVLPGTHHVAPFPTDAFVRKFQKQLAAPAGSFLILDAMLYHRSGINRSAGIRRAVNHVIGLPFMAQQIDIPSALSRMGVKTPTDQAMRKYLGYRWAPAADVADWRGRRVTK